MIDDDVVDVPATGRRLGVLIGVPLLVFLGVFVLILATSETAQDRSGGSPLLGQPAPDVVGESIDGRSFDLRDRRGQWTVVNFFSTTCPPCIEEHPELVEWSQAHAATGDAAIVSVAFDDRAENVRDFFAEFGGDWPVLVEDTGGIAVRYGVTGVPESYLIAPSGVVAAVVRSGVKAAEIDDIIEQVSGGS